MSYPGIDPADVQTMEPVGTQEPSAGEPKLLPPKIPQVEEQRLQSVIDPEQLKDIVQEAVADQFAITDGWRNRAVQFVVLCPSGQRALLKHLTTMDLVDAGLIEDMDTFTKALFPASFDQAGNPVENQGQESFWKQLKDPDKKLKFLGMLNRLLVVGVVNPTVVDDGVDIVIDERTGKRVVVQGTLVEEINGKEYLKTEIGNRLIAPNEVRASAIDFTDKMTIFSEFNKPLDQIKPFRESPVGVPSVDSEQGSGSTTQ